MCKAQALRKAHFNLLRGIDQCVISSSKYGSALRINPYSTYVDYISLSLFLFLLQLYNTIFEVNYVNYVLNL